VDPGPAGAETAMEAAPLTPLLPRPLPCPCPKGIAGHRGPQCVIPREAECTEGCCLSLRDHREDGEEVSDAKHGL